MNDEHPTPPADDRLERAMDAMRAIKMAAIPEAMIRQAKPQATPWHLAARRIAIAASVAVIVGTGAFLAFRPMPALAFDEVVTRIEKTRTMTATVVDRDGRPMAVSVKGKRMRAEGEHYISISDISTGEALLIYKQQPTATRYHFAEQPIDVIADFRQIATKATVRIEPRQFGDVRAIGFAGQIRNATTGADEQVRVWVDPNTRLPVYYEMLDPRDKTKILGHIQDFAFDGPLDEGLFSLIAPDGYQVTTQGVRAADLKAAATTREGMKLVLDPDVGIGDVRWGMRLDEIRARLGEPDVVDREEFDVEYYSRGFRLMVDQRVGLVGITAYSRDYLTLANVHDFPGKTDRGIGMGATRADVVAAYGEPTSQRDEGLVQVMRYAAMQLSFSLKGDKVVSIALDRPRPK